jgi:galactokinase
VTAAAAVDDLAANFERAHGRPPEGCWAAPGRVNLVGEHTDYNGGYVLPVALEFGVTVAASARSDGVLTAHSLQQPGAGVEVAVDTLDPAAPVTGWAAYPSGVVWALGQAGHRVDGLDIVVDGDVPQGAGLSSSAALECATALACRDLFRFDLARPQLAALAQRAENDFVGMPCGIMDQSASLLCEEGHALFLDTLTLATEQVPLDLAGEGLALLVIDTRAPHRLVDGEYASRRRSCEQAARALGVTRLRDVDLDGLDGALGRLDDPVLRRRVRHVVTENARVIEVVERLRRGDPRGVGPAMVASHESLRDDYEVSAPELDAAVDAALGAGALGARMTGGGFGGCAIALVEAGDGDRIVAAVQDAFATRDFTPPEAWTARAAAGARRVAPAPLSPGGVRR